MSRTRYVIEGTWSGYTSRQSRIVHREVTTWENKARKIEAGCPGIRFTDGTWLYLTVRIARPREVVKPIHGYGSLIESCVRHGVWSVDELMKVRG